VIWGRTGGNITIKALGGMTTGRPPGGARGNTGQRPADDRGGREN